MSIEPRSPRNSVLWNVLRLASISLAVQFTLDALIFRTTFYSRYIEPESYSGSWESALRNEQTRILPRARHILVMGDSSIAEGFSAPRANDLLSGTEWFFSSVGTPAATPRAWYYLVRDLEALATRYSVIVLPVSDFEDADGIEPPDVDVEADRELDLNRLIVRLRLTDVFSFPFTYNDTYKQLWALSGTIFKGLVYSRDVQELVRAPGTRLEKAALFLQHSREWKDDYPGRVGSMEGLRYDPASQQLTFPPGVSSAEKKILTDRFHPERRHIAGLRRAYRERWLGGMIDHYQAKGAMVVFFRVPTRPIPLPGSVASAGVTFLQSAGNRQNVIVLDESLFSDLETPEMFFDAFHLNRRGREAFTPRLARAVVDAVARRQRP